MGAIGYWFEHIEWWSLISGALLGAASLGMRTVIQAPVKALSERSIVIKRLSWLSPQRPFSGIWRVTWKVDSSRLAAVNSDNIRIYSLFGNVSFETTVFSLNGSAKRCVFVGKLVDKTLTGRWFDPNDAERGYFGVFQVRLHGGLADGAGAWVGWENDGGVQANDLMVEKLPLP